MATGEYPEGLELTEDEAYAILSLCLTSPQRLDALSEGALRKLADYCCSKGSTCNNHSLVTPRKFHIRPELDRAGA